MKSKTKAADDILGPIPEEEQVRIQVINVSSTVSDPLHNVSFECQPGKITLVMAPFHSGESTLLRILASQAESISNLSGAVLFTGRPELDESQVAAVIKDDRLNSSQLVAESLMQAAEERTGREGCGALTDGLLEELALSDIKYRRIGEKQDGDGDGDGISHNERKRLRLAQDLVTNPPLIICHEPFAGAGSEQASTMSRVLRHLADNGHTVVIGTDEGMAQELYEKVDTVLLLSRGKVCYYGAATQAEAWFEAQGHRRAEGASVPDFMVDLSDGALADDSEEGEFKRAESVEVAAAYLREFPGGYQGGTVPEMTDDDDEGDGKRKKGGHAARSK